MTEIKTFVFLDLETTGLPHLEYNSTKITEMCAVAVQADHIELGCFPRVHNKLSFCFNPNKVIQPDSTDITGLSNHLLEHQASFTSGVVDIVNNWIGLNKKPICLVAHNGSRFDYPILRAEIHKTGNALLEDIICVDSLLAFRALDQPKEEIEKEKSSEPVPFIFDDGFDELLCKIGDEMEEEYNKGKLTPKQIQKINETTPKKQRIGYRENSGPKQKPQRRNLHQQRVFTSYKLQDVFSRLTGKEAINAHEAEADVTMLITCAAVYGEKFVTYANENAKKFSEVPMMKPFTKLGT